MPKKNIKPGMPLKELQDELNSMNSTPEKSLKELQDELNSLNLKLYKLRRAKVLAAVALATKTHTISRIVEARVVCFENADELGFLDQATEELEHLEILLDITYD